MEDLRDLRLFLHVTETLNFGRSSTESHVSPATLTRAIQRLEARAGRQLLERGPRGVSITADGLRFREYARGAVELWDRYRAAEPTGTGLQGQISIFATVTACQAILPDLIRPFRADHPDVRLELTTGDAAVAIARVDEGSVDLALAAIPARVPASMVSRVVTETSLEFVAPAGSGPVDGRFDWAAASYLLPRTGLGRDAAQAWFRASGIAPTVVAEPPGHEALLALVALGYGLGVVPRLVLETSTLRDQVRVLSPRPPLPTLRIGLCAQRTSLRRPIIAELWSRTPELPESTGTHRE
ncbi:HTH-type transcriptional activator IlvY [Microlunatus speluncae]|uniref:HTH-type transcriptional activator IlvY n=1 Tax=Microlunatus speluncae TaxID=2594267 RepID=UPI001266591B|nr:HTH-type transcriptional activator IlvY [Microlunatus speluncae]